MYYKVKDTDCYKLVIAEKPILELNKDEWYIDEVYWYDDTKKANEIDIIHLTIRSKEK